MKLGSVSKYPAVPSRILMSILVILAGVHIVQGIIIAVEELSVRAEILLEEADKDSKPDTQPDKAHRIDSAAKDFLPDGTLHLVHQAGNRRDKELETLALEVYDVNDNLLWQGLRKDMPYEHLEGAVYLSSSGVFNRSYIKSRLTITPELSEVIRIPIKSGQRVDEFWQYEAGRDVFAGYKTRGERIGWLGAQGFTTTESAARPFGSFTLFSAWSPQDSANTRMLWQTERRLYEIGFENRRVEILFDCNEGIEQVSMLDWRFKGAESKKDSRIEYRPLLVCKMKGGQYHLLLREPDEELTVLVPQEWDKWFGNGYSFTATKDAIFLTRYWWDVAAGPDRNEWRDKWEQWWKELVKSPQKRRVELYRVASDGALNPVNSFNWIRPAVQKPIDFGTDRQRTRMKSFVRLFSPAAYDLAWELPGRRFWNELRESSDSELGGAVGDILRELRPEKRPLSWAIAAVLTVIAFVHHRPRRSSAARTVFWLVFVAAFGLAGLLTYLALNHTPVIRCPLCGRRRGLEMGRCVWCAAELPAPRAQPTDLILAD